MQVGPATHLRLTCLFISTSSRKRKQIFVRQFVILLPNPR
jgi:hypothetical protein